MLGQEVGGGIDGLGHGGDRAEEELHSSRSDARGRGRRLRWLVDGIWEDPEGDDALRMFGDDPDPSVTTARVGFG